MDVTDVVAQKNMRKLTRHLKRVVKFWRINMSYVYHYTYEDKHGEEKAIEVHYTFSKGRPAKTYGPPENCYPAEDAEVDILYFANPISGNEITDEELPIDVEDVIDSILETHINESHDDYDDPDTDYGDEY